ncbi:ADP-ribosylglycohydrolase family protein [Paenibacillus nasutitermitis]|uniref:ADP-ribosylglycohydrolase family protein n=1 Tax=Paenibacillus nasutitermitis TaxID=1652958 RepID=A0A917E244_9BACL|nr:ADP-ribosylglycohydrolase family protein [Paenibacillus nasutitermitis]GGD95088.1 hypothetical protein GCM10010911_62200 [Paenibacillus nasutitermitis]
MGTSILNEQDYYRMVYGGWLGKNIGGTLGAPIEGVKELLNLDFYPELPDGPLENDDLDLQLVWLHALEQYGPGLTCKELGQEWVEHVFFPFDEYGYAVTNLRRGLVAPVAGWFNNPFTNCMGSPIRSEIWAMVAPGSPETAAHYAYHDAIVDHAGGEGVYGEMFFAAIESAIFLEQDRDRLIEIGLTYIPPDCRTALAVKDLLIWHKEGKSWTEARSLILLHHGDDNFTDAPQNIAFTLLGWLYGEDFEDAILKAANCGYDTDCTAATLGAILGMILGPEGLPEKWVKPVGDRVVVSPPIKGFPAPANLDELTRRTIRMGKHVLAAWDTGIMVHPELPTSWSREADGEAAVQSWWDRKVTANHYLLPQGTCEVPDLELVIDYGDKGPSIGREQSKSIEISITNNSLVVQEGNMALDLPAGWQGGSEKQIKLQPGETIHWAAEIRSSAEAAPTYDLALRWVRMHDGHKWSAQRVPFSLVAAMHWTVWGPDNEEGKNVIFAGSRMDWVDALMTSRDGVYRAKTWIQNPSKRKIRLIAAANAPVKAKLNGTSIIDCQEVLEFMPAYHRPQKDQFLELTLPAGVHELDIEVLKQGDPLEVYVLTVSTGETQTPGSYYSYIDMLFVNQ